MTIPLALIIEDDPKLGQIFSAALKGVGFETTLDQDGTQYRSLLEDRIPSIVLLDVHLPFASGVDILKVIRSDERWKNIPVVLMTADFITAKSLEEQADQVLIKPVSVSRIQEIALKMIS